VLAMQSNRGAFDTQEERDILFLTLKWSAFIADKSTTQVPPNIAVPVETIRDVVDRLEEVSPGI